MNLYACKHNAMQITANLSCDTYEFKKYFIGDLPVFVGYLLPKFTNGTDHR